MIEVETLKRIYVEEEAGVFIEIGDCPDVPEFIEVRSCGQKNKYWWGEFRFSMTDEYALALGKALIEIAEKRIYSCKS